MVDQIIVREPEVYQKNNKIKNSYLWNISDSTLRKSSFNKYNQIGKSIEYKSKNKNEKSWRLDYYPWSHTIASMRFSRFQLILLNTNQSNQLTTHVSIVNSVGKQIIHTNPDGKILFPIASNGNLYFDHSVKLDDIVGGLDTLTTNDCLNILIEIEQSTDNNSAITTQPSPISELNNQSESQLQNGIFNFFLNKQFSDVTIDVLGKTFKAHRLILKIQSPVLSKMLDDEKFKKSKEQKIYLKNVEPEIAESMLEFIYSNREPKKIEHQTVKLMAAAHAYEINKLEKMCIDHLVKKLNQENAIRTLIFAHKHGIEILKVIVFNFIKDNASLLNSKDFKELEKNNPCLALETVKMFVEKNGK